MKLLWWSHIAPSCHNRASLPTALRTREEKVKKENSPPQLIMVRCGQKFVAATETFATYCVGFIANIPAGSYTFRYLCVTKLNHRTRIITTTARSPIVARNSTLTKYFSKKTKTIGMSRKCVRVSQECDLSIKYSAPCVCRHTWREQSERTLSNVYR